MVISKGKEGAVQLRERWWIFPRVIKHEAFPWTQGANGLQTSHKAEVLRSNNLKIGCGCKWQKRKSAPFQITGKLRCIHTDNGFKQVQKAYLALISYLDKLVHPSCMQSVQTSPQAIPWARGSHMSCVEAFVTGIKIESSHQSPFGGLIKGSRWFPNR